jgi:hypothetical protein
VEAATLTRADEAWPAHVEGPDVAAEQPFVNRDQVGVIGDRAIVRSRADALGERPQVCRTDASAIAGDRLVDVVTIVDLLLSR